MLQSRSVSRLVSSVFAASALTVAARAQGLPVTLWSQNGPAFPGANFGEGVAGLGDLDGDGKSDWIVGAPGLTVSGLSAAGRATVYYSSGATPVQLDGTTAFERFGASLSSAGDQNGDGKPEFLVAAPNHSSSGMALRGRIALYDGATCALITQWWGLAANMQWGVTMCTLGDLDGDGKSEYAFNGNTFSTAFAPLPAIYVMSGALNQVYCTQISFANTPNSAPYDIDSAGDMNGNGAADLIVGRGADTQVYALPNVFGGATSLMFTIPVRGEVVAGPGDVNADGVRDIAIANRNLGPLGGLQGFVGVYSGATQAQLWSVLGSGGQDEFGASMCAISDFSGDGAGELVVGAPQRQSGFLGTGYVRVLSGANGVKLAEWIGTGSPSNPAQFGSSVANAGDVDGDGKQDYLIGDRGRDLGTQIDAGFAMIAKGALAGATVGTQFCHCPPSSPAACGNTHNGLGGCLNTLGTPGLLAGFGTASVTADDLFLVASGLPASSTVFFFSGTASAAPGFPLYSGLMCVTGTITRLPAVTASNGVAVKGPHQLAAQGGYLAGTTAFFQAQYRNINGPCGANANQTNALAVTFTP
ncbi:MAG: hypothetical protein IT454_18925 [Planctomycetes bacterium]|nr:hypothetical protein [Planctomycetota bacterium]